MLSQLVANAILAGSIYATVAIGFTLIYRVVKFFHFTHGIIFTLGAYYALTMSEWLAVPTVVAGIVSVAVCALTGLMLNALIFKPLRDRSAAPLVGLLASLGLYVVGQNLISLLYGDNTLSIRGFHVAAGIEFLGARVTPTQLLICACSWVTIGTVVAWLTFTRTGTQLRALSNDATLAAVHGIRTAGLTAVAVMLGSALAGLAGFLSALDQDMVPTMGMNALLMAVVAMIVGGYQSLSSVAAAAMLVALAQNLSLFVFPAAWQDAVAFFIMIVFLVLRPQGIAGIMARS